jgi:predicted SAM-dependent methyltransferase
MKLNLGGGSNWNEPGWANVEDAFGHDLNTDLLTNFETNTVELIFFSHCLEHISWKNVPLLLRDCYRVLKLNGTMRIIVPDVDKLWDISKNNRKEFLKINNPHYYGNPIRSDFNIKTEMEELMGFYGADDFLNREKMHNSFFNISSLSLLLRAVGFEQIYQSDFKNSDVEEMRKEAIRDNDGMPTEGFDNSLVKCISLYMECVK